MISDHSYLVRSIGFYSFRYEFCKVLFSIICQEYDIKMVLRSSKVQLDSVKNGQTLLLLIRAYCTVSISEEKL